MSKLLINEPPLQALPSLAVALGNVNLAIIVQQIHYWIADERAPELNGRCWHYGTYAKWRKQFPWLAEVTIKGLMLKLEKAGLVISCQPNEHKGDSTKWYSLDYERLEELNLPLNTPGIKNIPPPYKKYTTLGSKVSHPYKEEETTKETIKKDLKENTKRKSEAKEEPLPLVAEGGEEDLNNGLKATNLYFKQSPFEDFWMLYPKKVGKKQAEKAFKGALKTVNLFTLLEAIDKQSAERAIKSRRGVFVPEWPHPSTWLNNERWNDSVSSEEEIKSEVPKTGQAAQMSRANDTMVQMMKGIMERQGSKLDNQDGESHECRAIRPV